MLLSEYLLPVLKEQPKEAKIISHSLMLKTGTEHYTTKSFHLDTMEKRNTYSSVGTVEQREVTSN